MKKNFLVISLFAISTFMFAQTAPPAAVPANGAPTKISPGSVLPVVLSKTVDAKKAHTGDQVLAKIPQDLSANGKVVIPQDTKVIGHVAEVKASDHDSKDSKLGIVFDKMSMKDGSEIPLMAEIQALRAPDQPNAAGYGNAPAPSPQESPAGTNQNSPMGNGNNNAPSAPQPNQTAGMSDAGAEQSAPPLTGSSQGVIGMKGYSLSQGTTQDSVITSPEHNVKLESGTQILLKTK
jgi:hypothetical protein